MFNKGIARKLGIKKPLIYFFDIAKQTRLFIANKKKAYRLKSNPKIFCIGNNKTGTTSIQVALLELGYIVGNQREAELLAHNNFDDNFTPLIEYCKTAEAFQDVPFSWPDTYKHLDKAFPGSKFILTVRDSPEQWYNSLVTFHAKIFGKDGAIPTVDDLKNATYAYKGWVWEGMKKLYKLTDDEDPYPNEKLMAQYVQHNQDVIDYFKNRKQDLLVINLADEDSYQTFCAFIGVKSQRSTFPWENKTANLSSK